MADTIQTTAEQAQAADQPRPADEIAVRHVLVGYGHQLKQMPASTLKTYREMERDYTVGMCLGLLTFPIVASQWTVEVKDVGEEKDQTDDRSDQTDRSDTIESDSTAEQIQSTLTDMLAPIWRDTVKYLLTAISRKAAPCEKRFEIRDGKLWLRKLDPIKLEHADLLLIETIVDGQKQRRFGGMAVKVPGASLTREQQRAAYGNVVGDAPDLTALTPDRVPVPAWKTLWFAIDSTDGELVGESQRMERAKRSWWSKASQGGLLDVEDIWFRQRVTDPVEVYYREGTRTDGRNNADVALELGQNYQAHGVLAIPLGLGQTPETADFVVKKPEGQKESKQIPQQIDQSIDPRIMFAFAISPLVGGAKQEVGAYSLGEVLVKFLLWNIEDIGEQITQALSKWVLQPLVNWNWGPQWSVCLKINSLSPEVVALLREIVKGLFAGAHSGKLVSLLDLASTLQEAGLTLADDAAERIEEIRKDLAGGGSGLADKLASLVGANGQRLPASDDDDRTDPTDRTDEMPDPIAARLRGGSPDPHLDELVDEAADDAADLWEMVRGGLKKKTHLTSN